MVVCGPGQGDKAVSVRRERSASTVAGPLAVSGSVTVRRGKPPARQEGERCSRVGSRAPPRRSAREEILPPEELLEVRTRLVDVR